MGIFNYSDVSFLTNHNPEEEIREESLGERADLAPLDSENAMMGYALPDRSK